MIRYSTLKYYSTVVISFLSVILTTRDAEAHNPTWTDGIACIIYSHCTGCHNQNGIAPFSLMTYTEVFENRFSIAESVQAGSMPPFPASQNKRKYAHANTLSTHEIDEIVDWVNNFAPLGDANNIPTPPTYSSGYSLLNPDFVGQIPTYTVSSDNDVYRMFVIPVNNSQQQTIQRIEVFPGNREIVHHALVFQDTSTTPLELDQNDPLPGYSAFGGTGSPSSRLLTVFTPGQGAFNFAPGFGALLLPNSYIIIQMHYPGGVMGEVDSTQVRLKYGPSTLRNVTTNAVLNHNFTLVNGPLFIPANTVTTFYSQTTSNINRTLTGIMPHMHLIGTSIKAYAVTPNGDTIHLIDIPEWDFHWQYFYQFQKPILIPAGSELYGEATYDNTINNPNNPNNPPQDVEKGEGTEDEMFLIYMNLSTYQAGDTSIIIDTASHYLHDMSCDQVTTGINRYPNPEIAILPNPASEFVNITGIDGTCMVQVFDAAGKSVMQQQIHTAASCNIQSLPKGPYYIQVRSDRGEVFYKKLIKQ